MALANKRFAFAMDGQGSPSDRVLRRSDEAPADSPNALESISGLFVRAWRDGEQPRIERFLAEASNDSQDAILRALLQKELLLRKQAGDVLSVDEYLSRFPGHRESVIRAFDSVRERSADESTRIVSDERSTSTHRGSSRPLLEDGASEE
ncbi:MAG: Serine/threonine-protein kinase PknB [Planctomycetota bacterium]